VLGVNTIIAVVMFIATIGLTMMINQVEGRQAAAQPAE